MRALQRTSGQLFPSEATHRISKTRVLFAQIEIHAFSSSINDVNSGQSFALAGVKLRAMPCAIVMAARGKTQLIEVLRSRTAAVKQHPMQAAGRGTSGKLRFYP
jgi:hypothetical protein